MNERQVDQSSENIFFEFFQSLDENYRRVLISEMQKKPPDKSQQTQKAVSAGTECDPLSR